MSNDNKITMEEAIEMFADIFEEPLEHIQLDTRRENIVGWDSLGVLSLMAEFDLRFNISFSSGELEELNGINDLITILRNNHFLSEN